MQQKQFVRNIGTLIYLTLLSAGLSSCFTGSETPPAVSDTSPAVAEMNTHTIRYLALGDSITFGDNSFVPYLASTRSDPEVFVSYATILGKEDFDGKYINLACPGESSGSFLDQSAPDNGCQQGFRKRIKLKYSYEGAQVDAMTQLIKANPKLELISITLGGNDFFMLFKACMKEHTFSKKARLDCVDKQSDVYVGRFIKNMQAIVSKAKEAGFRGKFALLNGYALDYRDERGMANTKASNAKIKQALGAEGVKVIDIYTVFEAKAKEQGGDLCASGLMIKNPLPLVPAFIRCDVHPSPEGARLLAQTIRAAK